MLGNYLRITMRTIRRQKGYAFINIAGLSLGMAAFLLITLFVRFELGFDQFQTNASDLYRVNLDAEVMGQSVLTTNTPAPMAETLIDEFPEIQTASHVVDYSRILVTYGDQQYYEREFFLVDSTIFDILSIPLVSGDPGTALARPNTIVISQNIAARYFGNDNPLGKVLRVDNRWEMEVTGVMQNPRSDSHIQPELLGSWLTSDRANDPEWLNNSFLTYLRLRPGTAPATVEAKFPALIRKYVGPRVEQLFGQSYDEAIASGLRYEFHLEPVTDIYLYSKAENQLGPIGNIQYVYILSVIGLFVLTIAAINFMNLSTARAANRAREVGLRKVMGSDRRQLIAQFLGESIVMSLLSMVLAVGIVYLVLGSFNGLAGSSITIAPWMIGTVLLIALITGLLAGVYPAFVLSAFRPAVVLKGAFSSGTGASMLRSSLVVFQFAISIALVVGTGVVFKQLNFLKTQDLGFDKEQVVVLPIETKKGDEGFDAFRSEIIQQSDILAVAAAGAMPGPDHIHNNTAFKWEGSAENDIMLAATGEISPEFGETLGLRIVAGRDFSREYPTDVDGWLLNESAAKKMGWTPEEAIGKTVTRPQGNEDDSDRIGRVVGVYQDAHFESFHSAIRPMILGMHQNYRYIPIRIRPERTSETLAYLKEKWTSLEPGYPFRYYFVDEDYQRFYEQENRLGTIYSGFTVLAILIACLGLFGLASFVTTQRTKEIGVRKVLGASVPGIVAMLNKEFTVLVLIACAIAFPVSWFAMNRWLQDFAYATDIGWVVFVVSGLAALVIAWVTVAYQSIRAAVADPVKSLRYE